MAVRRIDAFHALDQLDMEVEMLRFVRDIDPQLNVGIYAHGRCSFGKIMSPFVKSWHFPVCQLLYVYKGT
jgi:hypothetical protein